jgi:hypothetical protein
VYIFTQYEKEINILTNSVSSRLKTARKKRRKVAFLILRGTLTRATMVASQQRVFRGHGSRICLEYGAYRFLSARRGRSAYRRRALQFEFNSGRARMSQRVLYIILTDSVFFCILHCMRRTHTLANDR